MLLINDAEHQKFRVSTNNFVGAVSFVSAGPAAVVSRKDFRAYGLKLMM